MNGPPRHFRPVILAEMIPMRWALGCIACLLVSSVPMFSSLAIAGPSELTAATPPPPELPTRGEPPIERTHDDLPAWPMIVRQIDIDDSVPFGTAAIDYHGRKSKDPIAVLANRISRGEIQLEFREPTGYLESLLDVLNVPRESQLLVFSKTSVNQRLIRPENPRAIYFSDDVYVGWVAGADAIELTGVDPEAGGRFYLLPQNPDAAPKIEVNSRCLACHVGGTTLDVPGHMVRSFLTDDRGKPIEGYSRITHDDPLKHRWGGWFVTGTHGESPHLGNIIGKSEIERAIANPLAHGNRATLEDYLPDVGFPTPHSDIVAHLVLDHQAHGQNLITRVAFEEMFGQHSDAEEQLLRYLLFADEPRLTADIRGTAGFREAFEQQGRQTADGRSLRQMNLKTRLFEHRLSYLVETPPFDALPANVQGRLYRRLWRALTANPAPPEAAHLAPAERTAIIEILRETKPNLPNYWRAQR